ncbi:MAG: sulfotransferase [Phycisphaerales bacterium]|nr:sulfotransferase [Phycisphaerales bacterium]
MSQNTSEAQLESFMKAGDLGRALQLATAMTGQDPAHHSANMALAKIRLMQGLSSDAQIAVEKVLGSTPDNEEAMFLMVGILAARGHTAQGLEWCDRIHSINPDSVRCQIRKAQLLERDGKSSKALELLDQPIVPAGDLEAGLINARCLIALKRYEEAIKVVDECLASWSLTGSASTDRRARFLYLRVKANDLLGRYDDAFADAKAAKQYTQIPFDPKAYVSEIDQIIQTFTRDKLEPLPGFEASEHRHLFIAGMPRSGTTLVEQILDAHPEGTGVGEAKEIHVIAARLQQTLGSWVPWPGCAASMTAQQRQQLSESYEQALIGYGFDSNGLFVNKNLLNLKFLGLIAMLFPGSKVVFTHRDPRDTGLSCFLGNFSTRVHPELQSIEHISLAVEQNRRLIDHWKSELPLEWMDVEYADMINDQDRVSRSLVEFAGLPWDDRCLAFYDSGRTVMTLSYDQVNKPIYSSSLGRYRNYESHLGPLLAD